MSRIYPEETWADGDIYSLDEPNREFAAIAGEMNGHIDVDNIPALLVTGAKAALDAFHEIIYIDAAGPDAFNAYAGVNFWETLETTTITTEDGMIRLEGQMTFDSAIIFGASTVVLELGILVDGQVAARSGWSSGLQESDSLTCVRAYPVGPGDHTVELAIRRASSGSITINGRTLFGRFLAR